MSIKWLDRFICCGLVISATVGCKTTSLDSSPVERWDSRNGPERFGAEAVTYDLISQRAYGQGAIAQVPWTDTYWPLKNAGFAARWIDHSQAAPFQITTSVTDPDYERKTRDEIDVALADAAQKATGSWQELIFVSPAEKYDIAVGDLGFSLTKSELQSYAHNRQRFKDLSWGWMGHCHGWAPASYLFEAPKRGVLMQNEATGKEVLWTPGDVRGLLTKASSDNPFDVDQNFMGTRCNDADSSIPKDELGRIIDGALGTWSAAGFSNHVPVRILLNNWWNYSDLNSQQVEIVFKIGPDFDSAKPLWLVGKHWIEEGSSVVGVDVFTTDLSPTGELSKAMLIVSSEAEKIGQVLEPPGEWRRDGTSLYRDQAAAHSAFAQALAGANVSVTDASNFLAFKYYKACRDLNAGAFHTVLARYLAEGREGGEPRSFVMDITRDDQVWNHAIYDYVSSVGEPTPLSINSAEETLTDPFQTWRAEGTTHIVDVYTRVTFAVENGPRVTYQPEDEATKQKVWHYTLELDASGTVIGGEWHGIATLGDLTAKSGADLLRSLRRTIGENLAQKVDSPDFVWGFQTGASVIDGRVIRADFVKKLHACSLDADARATSITIQNHTFDYVTCTY